MVSTETLHTKEIFSDFAKYSLNKKMKMMTILYVCSAVISVCAIILLVLGEYVRGALYLFLGVFFGFYGVLVRFLITLGNKKEIGITNIYEFDEDKFSVSVVNKESKEIGKSFINYEALYSVELYKNYAYIYINKVTAYIIIKENFKNETEFYSLVDNLKRKVNNPIKNLYQGSNIGTSAKNNLETKDNLEIKDSNKIKKLETDNTKINEIETKEKLDNKLEQEEDKKIENEENEIIAKIKRKNANNKKSK